MVLTLSRKAVLTAHYFFFVFVVLVVSYTSEDYVDVTKPGHCMRNRGCLSRICWGTRISKSHNFLHVVCCSKLQKIVLLEGWSVHWFRWMRMTVSIDLCV